MLRFLTYRILFPLLFVTAATVFMFGMMPRIGH